MQFTKSLRYLFHFEMCCFVKCKFFPFIQFWGWYLISTIQFLCTIKARSKAQHLSL